MTHYLTDFSLFAWCLVSEYAVCDFVSVTFYVEVFYMRIAEMNHVHMWS